MGRDNLDTYKVWAPEQAIWSLWAKPVIFASMNRHRETKVKIPETPVPFEPRTMIIIDLCGKYGVGEALSYAAKGYRPVPLYNGVFGAGEMLVDVTELGQSLFSGADILRAMPLADDAPPVFMLDYDRMNGVKSPRRFDNRWCVFQQDMPSAQYLRDNSIDKIIVRTESIIRTDLERILYNYRKSGISLFALRADAKEPKELTVSNQYFFDRWAYRFKVTFGLTRNSTGGFGGRIPDPYEGGGIHYRFG